MSQVQISKIWYILFPNSVLDLPSVTSPIDSTDYFLIVTTFCFTGTVWFLYAVSFPVTDAASSYFHRCINIGWYNYINRAIWIGESAST